MSTELNSNLGGYIIQTGAAGATGGFDSNKLANVNITFDTPFSKPPAIICNAESSWLNLGRQTEPVNITATGFTARCYSGDKSPYGFHWIAVGK